MKKSIVITGASSGIGKATAKLFASNGWNVAATMRNPEKENDLNSISNVKIYKLDVTDSESIQKAKEKILKEFEQVDLVLNNAGYGLMGAFEEIGEAKIKRQFDTNIFGVMNVTRSFLPHFRENKSGMFINVTSIGGLLTFPFFTMYHATKWAVEGFSEALSLELNELGIQVKIVEPGGVRTDFAGRSMDMETEKSIEDYGSMKGLFIERMQGVMDSNYGSSAEEIAQGIYNAATDGKKQLRYILGDDAMERFNLRKEIGEDAYIQNTIESFLK